MTMLIENKLINLCGKMLRDEIVANNFAGLLILTDKTAKVSVKEQMVTGMNKLFLEKSFVVSPQ